jgi:DNA repair exonuclease SbcCD ATPase subunit
MKIKHKLLSDYQYLTPDKKIFVLKSGTIINNYIYSIKDESIPIDKDIIDNNPDFFEVVDYKYELLTYLKYHKIPQPAQMHKKLLPFIEEMILSSINTSSNNYSVTEDQVKELERKEKDLNSRDKRVRDKEEELDIRLKRVEKRETDYKEDLKSLDKKEDELRSLSRDLTEKQLDIEDKIQDLNEKERNFDRSLLESSSNLDEKYKILQEKIDSDLEKVSTKEKELEIKSKSLNKKENDLIQKEADIDDKIRDFNIKVEDFKLYHEEVKKIEKEIQDWENLHWKFKRNTQPPSTL